MCSRRPYSINRASHFSCNVCSDFFESDVSLESSFVKQGINQIAAAAHHSAHYSGVLHLSDRTMSLSTFRLSFAMQGLTSGTLEYELVGVVQHLGATLRSGHYTAFVQRGMGQSKPSANDSAYAPNSIGLKSGVAATTTELELGWQPPNTSEGERVADGNEAAGHLAMPTVHHSAGPMSTTPDLLLAAPQQPCQDGGTTTSAMPGCLSGHSKSTEDNCISEGSAAPQGTGARPSWFHITDTHVKPVSTQAVLDAEAYILMYQRAA